MANTLTELVPAMYVALDEVARERIGFLTGVTIASEANRIANEQDAIVTITQPRAAEDISEGQFPPSAPDRDFDKAKIEITKFRTVPFDWTGEEQMSIDTGPGYSQVMMDDMKQAFRTLTNEMEEDVAALYPYAGAGRVVESGGAFSEESKLTSAATARKQLAKAGCPISDVSFVLDLDAGERFRGNNQNLFRVDASGSDTLLRTGMMTERVFGFAMRESEQIKTHTKGNGSGFRVNDSNGLTAGTTTIPVDTGTGNIKVGDSIKFNGDAVNFYSVIAVNVSGSDGSRSGSIEIARPGLRGDIANNAAITIQDGFTANMFFRRNAIVLANRAPAIPKGGDAAEDEYMMQDPLTGLVFDFRVYRIYRKVRYEISCAWGVKAIKPEWIGLHT